MKLGSKVRTIARVYAGRQKGQRGSLVLLPLGTLGTIKYLNSVPEDVYALVRFDFEGKLYWAKVNPLTTIILD